MFPLGSVLLPGAVLPLHVFEPRYRQLVADCLAGEPEFGVALIERGSEVGGGDQRTAVGTVARIVQVGELPEGRVALVAVGTRRIRVNAWLPDDPYPLADVDDWLDTPEEAEALRSLVTSVHRDVRRLAALAVELGDSAADTGAEIADDPLLASYHLAALAPIGPSDRYDLLCAPGPRERLELLASMVGDVEASLRFRLGDD